ncbi:MAG: tetratricopeptide repeat protein [Anaerolineae bacterium]|nr:MAG: tetratricopeptide repeat protein [Anaerolineae bacterium]
MPAEPSQILLQKHLTLAETHRAHFRYEKALQLLDDALHMPNLSPADSNSIHLRQLAYKIEAAWLYNRLDAEFAALHSQLKVIHADALAHHQRPQVADALFLTARLHHFNLFEAKSPDLDGIEKRWIEAYSCYHDLDDSRGMAESLFYHGLLYQRFRADHEAAYGCFHRARNLIEYQPYPIELAEILRHTGYVYHQRGDLIAAHACHEQAVAYLNHSGFRVYLPLALYALGMVLMEQGRLDEAGPHFEHGLAVAEEAPPNILHIGALLGLGDFHAKTGDLALARDTYQKAQTIADALNATRSLKMTADKLAALPQTSV